MRPIWTTAHEGDKGERGAVLIVDMEDASHLIARVPPSIGRGDRQSIADLLAGAPVMYEICKAIIENHNKKWKDGFCFCDDCQLLLEAIHVCDGGYARQLDEEKKRARKKRRRKSG